MLDIYFKPKLLTILKVVNHDFYNNYYDFLEKKLNNKNQHIKRK